MSIKKQYLKNKPECKITFKVGNKNGYQPSSVKIVGDFNEWDSNVEPMKKLKTGEFTQTLNFPKDQTLQFRYLMDDHVWVNEDDADEFIDSGIGTEKNCLLKL